jgi:hypothetical protein
MSHFQQNTTEFELPTHDVAGESAPSLYPFRSRSCSAAGKACLYTPGADYHPFARPLASSWKPVLLYMLPDAKPNDFRPMQFNDVVLGVKSERSEVEADRVEHEWQQALVPVKAWIERLSLAGDLVACVPRLRHDRGRVEAARAEVRRLRRVRGRGRDDEGAASSRGLRGGLRGGLAEGSRRARTRLYA